MVTVAGKYRDGKIELEKTPPGVHDDDPVLVTFTVSERIRRQPVQLLGKWKGMVPEEEHDIDGILLEIRNEWLEEIEEFGLK